VVPLPSDVHCDPLRTFIALLEAGHAPQQVWPALSSGFEALLHSESKELPTLECDQLPPQDQSDNHAKYLQRLQEIFRRQRTADPEAPRSAIRAHQQLNHLIYAAQLCICTHGWFHDPSRAVFICADQSEAAEIEALLRRDDDLERGEDPLDSARWVAEELMAPVPGWRYSGPAPVLLADQVQSGDSWREVFLSPGCRGLRADQLLPAVGGAQVGLHIARGNLQLTA
jgi:hypothetical protein